MSEEPQSERTREARDLRRRSLIRDTLVFQGKLLMDALKDVILGPASLIATLMDLIDPRPRKDARFYKVLGHGKDASRAINLFEVSARPGEDDHWTVDEVIRDVEWHLRERYGSGSISDDEKRELDERLQNNRESGEGRQ